ncbi:MAG TPA: MFS transporter [Candidatus Eisenbacteria bacterium]
MLRWVDTVFPRRVLFQEDRRLLYLFAGRLISSTGFAIVIPFLALYLHGVRGIPMSAVGSVFFVAALAGALGQVVGGDMSDRYGRKMVLLISQFLRAVAFAGLGASVLWHWPFLAFVLLTSLSSIAGRMYEPPSAAMVADITHGEKRIEAYGVLRVGGNLGWALGPALGGFLAAQSYASLFFLGAFVLLVAGVLIALKVVETIPDRARREPPGDEPARVQVPQIGPSTGGRRLSYAGLDVIARDRLFLRYCVITLLLFLVMAQLMSTLSVFAVEWVGLSKVQLGFLYTLNGLMVVFLQFPATRLLGGTRMTTALTVGSLLYALGYGMMGWASGFVPLLIAMFIVTSGEIVSLPASMGLVANFSSEELRGRYMGVYGLFNAFGWSIGPLAGGALLDLAKGRPIVLWCGLASVTVIAAAGYWDLRRRIDPSTDRESAAAGRPAVA